MLVLERLDNGEKLAGASAILLFVFMFFHWFGVEAVSPPGSLLVAQSIESKPGKDAWEALEYIPMVLVSAILVTLAMPALRLTRAAGKDPVPVSPAVAILGLASALLILFRVIHPPDFGSLGPITYEGTVQWPIFLALAAAFGIAYGGYRAMRESGASFADLRRRR